MKKQIVIYASVVAALVLTYVRTEAQLNITAQLRTRTELRDGQGAPLPKGADPAFFTSQRTRLSLGYLLPRLKLTATLQDVRVWGQDVSTINRTTPPDNNGMLMHEAWAEIMLLDTVVKNKWLNVKIGRQELVYDDQRLLGNLDWLQQGRRHDAAVIKFESKVYQIHAGAAFNQNRESAAGTIYNSNPAGNYTSSTNGGNMYKSIQYLYAGKKLKNGNASFLFLTDRFSKYRMDTINNSAVKTFTQGSWSRATTGFFITNTFKQLNITASAYYQFGKNATNQRLHAWLLSGFANYNLSKNLSAGAGVDYTSGGSTGTSSNTFDPLYGTPHKFWGLMDYFYVASPFGKNGLVNYYVKTKYKPYDRLMIAADFHQFSSAARINNVSSNKKNFGQEINVVGNYTITKQIGIEAGIAHFFATPLLTSPLVKNVTNARTGANWAYVMINVKPEFLFK